MAYTKYGVTHGEAPVDDQGWEWRDNGFVTRFDRRKDAVDSARLWARSSAATGPRVGIVWRFRDGADPYELGRFWSEPIEGVA